MLIHACSKCLYMCINSFSLFLLPSSNFEHMGSEHIDNVQAHMSQPAESDHANFLALGDARVTHG